MAKSYGFIYNSGSFPDGSIFIPMDSSNYTSSVSAAASKLGATTPGIFTSTTRAATATATFSDFFTSSGGIFTLSFPSTTASQTGSASATQTESSTATTSSGKAGADSTSSSAAGPLNLLLV